MKKARELMILILSFLTTLACAIAVSFAVSITTSIRGNIQVSTITNTVSHNYTSNTGSLDFTFNKAGDKKVVSIESSNSTQAIVHTSYQISATGDENLTKAILVYLNDEYVGTLNNVTTLEDEFNFVALGGNTTDTITFELHQAAALSVFDNKSVSLTITSYSATADYTSNMYVSSSAEFKKAVDDCNSGLIENPKIILCNSIVLTDEITIKSPITVYLNNATLSGALTIDDDETADPDALLTLLGNGSFTASVTLGHYNVTAAKQLVIDTAKDLLCDGVVAGTTDAKVVGNYKFYGVSVTPVSSGSYNKANDELTVLSGDPALYSGVEYLEIAGDTIIEYKVIGSKVALIDDFLSHLPASESTVVSRDLFLPTYIPSQNATIVWSSENSDVMNNKGVIVSTYAEKEPVTLNAEIKVNNTVYTQSYSFLVSAHNNEINFYQLVQYISPLVIKQADADYYLPTVGDHYDYRTAYNIFNLTDEDPNYELYNWAAYKEIYLTSLTYSMTPEQQEAYDFITITGDNAISLNRSTFANFAQITVTGTFDNGEQHSTVINISIDAGSDTQLIEKAFGKVDDEINEVNILGNILKTRKESGFGSENGDFTLNDSYQSPTGDVYKLIYSSNSPAITVTADEVNHKYNFAVNPEYFSEYEAAVPITCRVVFERPSGNIESSRIFYVTLPAALHRQDFTTASIFNSVKYQVFNSLPSAEKSGDTGFSTAGTTLTNATADYLLIRDIVGDDVYVDEYSKNTEYQTVANITAKAAGTTSLDLSIAPTNEVAATDTDEYTLAQIINWALDDSGNRVVISSITSDASLTSLSSTKSNGKSFISEAEEAVIEAFYKAKTNNSSWDEIFDEVFNVAPGYIYDTSAILVEVLNCLKSQNANWYENTTRVDFGVVYAKYIEIINRYATTTSMNASGIAPARDFYDRKFNWYKGTQQVNANLTITDHNGTIWYRVPAGGGDVGYEKAPYLSDKTKYITENELFILKLFWLNSYELNNASMGCSTEFTDENKAKLQAVLNNNPDAYAGYTISDFDTFGKAIINAFDASLSLPTYFKEDGIKKLIAAFDQNYNANGYQFKSYTNDEDSTTFLSKLNGNAPYVTNLDCLESSLSYFKNLTSLSINGKDTLNAFLSEFGLTKAFARIANSNTELTALVMTNVAPSYLDFDITNIKLMKNLQTIDLSKNDGLSNVNPLINPNRGNYTSVNIRNIGEEYKYLEFTIDNLASNTCQVLYSDGSNNPQVANTSKASYLSSLSDIDDFVSEYMFLTNVIYTDDGSSNIVCWRVEEGNDIYKTEILAGEVHEKIETANAMNMYVSPYYYANTTFNYCGNTFTQGNVYKVIVSGGNLQVTQVLTDKTITLLNSFKSDYTEGELEGVATPHSDNKIDNETVTDKSTYISDTTIFTQNIVGDEQTYTINYNYCTFSQRVVLYVGYTQKSPKKTAVFSGNYYLSVNDGTISYTEDANADSAKFVILNEAQANFIKTLKNGNYVMSREALQQYITAGAVTANGNSITVGMANADTVKSESKCYFYNPASGKFLSKPGTSDNPVTSFKFDSYSATNVTTKIKENNGTQYITGTKIVIWGKRANVDPYSYIKSLYTVRYYKNVTDGDLTLATESNKEYNRLTWTLSGTTFGQITETRTLRCRTNTPVVTVTQAEETQENYNIIFNYYTFSKKSYPAYMLTDTGSYITNLNTTSANNLDKYFVLMSEADCLRLENWYRNPTNNATFGQTIVGSSTNGNISNDKDDPQWYLYNIYSQKYVMIDDPSGASSCFPTTPDYRQASKFYVTNEFIYFKIPGTETRVFFNAWTGYNSGMLAGWDGNGDGSTFYASALQTYIKTETIVKPQETTQYAAYQFGYTVYRYEGNINKYDKSMTFNQAGTYYLTEDLVVNVKGEHSNTVTPTTFKAGSIVEIEYDAYYAESYLADLVYYVTEFWCITDGVKTTIPINSGEYSFSYYYQNGAQIKEFSSDITFTPHNTYSQYDSGFSYTDVDGNTIRVDYGTTSVTESDTNYEAQWFTSCTANGLESQVKSVSSGDPLDTYVAAYNNSSLFQCVTGGTDTVFDSLDPTNNDSINFANNGGYSLQIKANNQLGWVYSGYTLTDVAENQTMDYFLTEANSHFADAQYSVYYGMYYGYAGPTETTKLGNTYESKYIYRLMPNNTNTAFEWVKVQPFKEAIGVDIMSDSATGAASVGDVYYCTKNGYSGFIPKDYFYKIEYDPFTDTLNMVHFNDVNFVTYSGSVSKVKNEKIQYVSSNEYIGYAGTFEIEISAVIRNIGGEDIVKTYKLKFVGAVIE